MSIEFDYFHRLLDPQPEIFHVGSHNVGPPVISWILNPINYIYVYIYTYNYTYDKP